LHTQAAVMLRLALRSRSGITITDVPYHLDGQLGQNGAPGRPGPGGSAQPGQVPSNGHGAMSIGKLVRR
jgi:hypothetical protein